MSAICSEGRSRAGESVTAQVLRDGVEVELAVEPGYPRFTIPIHIRNR